MRLREREIQNAIIREFGQDPRLRIFRINTGVAMFQGRKVRFGIPGMADITGVLGPAFGDRRGVRVDIEVKSETGVQSAEQKAWQRIMEEMGAIYILARSPDDVRSVLNDLCA